MNTAAKGARHERQARDLLYAWGAHLVLRSGASKGPFDLIALFPGEVVLVQVKSNRPPSPAERQRLKNFPNLSYLRKLCFRYNDGDPTPDITPV